MVKMVVKLDIPATSVKNIGDTVYMAVMEGDKCKVDRLRGKGVEGLVSIAGSPCVLLWGRGNELLISAGNTLHLVSGSEAKPVLRAGAGNWFWHAAEGGGAIFVQEYGRPPTGIYASEDLVSFRRVVTNVDVDPTSRHFHYIAFDRDRELLVATLGDGNIVRAAVSGDRGLTWRPIYRGAWQFVPVLVERDRWVFGFDSGIAKGGIGVYSVESRRWHFILLKPGGRSRAQLASLVRLGGYLIGGLGAPTAIIVSENLRQWHPLHVDTSAAEYNHFVSVEAWGDRIVATTGRELLIFSQYDVGEALRREPILAPYGVFLDRVRGAVYAVKRDLWRFWA